MSNRIARIVLGLSWVVVAVAALCTPAVSRDYPNQIVKFIVPYSAGGLPDTVARIVANALEKRLKQTIVVENRPGSGGGIAAQAVANAPADGYQLIITDNSFLSTNPLLYKQLSYDPKDFVSVAQIANGPLFLALHPSVPAKSLTEFVDYVKANPGKVNYGSSGVGTMHHLSMEALRLAYKLDLSHVPFRGSGQSVPALLGGHVQALFSAYPSLSGAAEAKQIVIVAENAAKRSEILPQVPPISDFIPGFDFASRIGIFARNGTPDAIITLISREVIAVTKDPDLVSRFAAAGIEPAGSGPDEYRQALKDETSRVEAVVRAARIEPQ